MFRLLSIAFALAVAAMAVTIISTATQSFQDTLHHAEVITR